MVGEKEVRSIARLAQRAFVNGKIGDVAWKRLGLVQTEHGPLAELEVDLARTMIPVRKLVHDDTIHHLSTHLGLPVVYRNTDTVIYGVLLQPQKRPRVPDEALLPEPPGRLMVPLGRGAGEDVWVPLEDLDTMIVAGTRGFGKSSLLNTVLASLLAHHAPDELRVALIDPKVVELMHWNDAPHLIAPVARDDENAFAVLGRLNGIVQERIALFQAARVNSLNRYAQRTGEPLPRVLLVVDELAEVKAGLDALASIMRLGRAFGVHAILSTQYPDAKTVSAQIRANVLYRVAFHLPTTIMYQVALQASTGDRMREPEMLPGRMVARTPEGYKRLQAFWLPESEIERVGREVAAGKVGGGLSRKELVMVEFALSRQGGKLTQTNIAAALGLTAYKAEKFSAKWQELGWLKKDPNDNNACYVTDALRAVSDGSRRLQAVPDVPGS